MARSPLTLAALATSAVAGLDVARTARFGSKDGGDYDSALLTARDGTHSVIRVPRSSAAESQQSADLVALRALSVGVRERLPFDVAHYLGQAAIGSTRAVVYDWVPGESIALEKISTGPEGLAASIGRAVAAIHALPTSFVADAGMPVLTAGECLRASVTIMDRASATGLVPASLVGRWERASEDSTLWQFQPTVIHGSLTAASLLVVKNDVSGVLGWQDLRVGDPAKDLQWLLGARREGIADGAFDAYQAIRGAGDRQLRQRAKLYSELELARWLLHGTETRSTEIVDDAVGLLTALSESLRSDVMNPIGTQTMPTATIDDVEAMLERAKRAV